MVREHSVGVKELTALGIGTERSKNIGGIESADAVSRVNNNLESLERLVVIFGINAFLISRRCEQ